MPAMTMAWLSEVAPATPMTSARLETRPSLPPKTAGRRKAVARLSCGDIEGGGIRAASRRRETRVMGSMMMTSSRRGVGGRTALPDRP